MNINPCGVTVNVYVHEEQEISALADEIEERTAIPGRNGAL